MATAARTGFVMRKMTTLEIVAYIVASALVIFYIDVITPLGLTVWILYFIPLFLTLDLRWKYAPFLVTGIIIILIAVSFSLSPRDMSELYAIINRIFFSLLLLVVTFFIWRYNRNMDNLWITEERYRFMTECSPDAIIVYREGRILYANLSGQRLFGAEKNEDLVGKDIIGLFAPGEQSGIREKIRQSVLGVRLVLDRIRMVRLNGTAILAQVSLGKVFWDGEPALLASIRVIGDT